MKELEAGSMVPVGYPVPRRAVPAGPVAAGVLVWASRLAGPAAAQTSRDLGRAGRRGLATYASFDAGSTWHSNGLLPGIVPAYDGDVTVAFDRQGTGYVSGWAGSRAHAQRGRVCLWRTADGGRSFTTPVTVATGLVDHSSLAADRWARGPGTVYVAGGYFGRGGLVFTRST